MSPLGGCFGCWFGGEVASSPRSRVQPCKPLGPQSTPCILADSLAIAFAALRTQSTGCDLFRNPVDHCLFRSRSRWSVRHFVDPWRRRCARRSCAECSSPARLVPRRLRLHKKESPSVTETRGVLLAKKGEIARSRRENVKRFFVYIFHVHEKTRPSGYFVGNEATLTK